MFNKAKADYNEKKENGLGTMQSLDYGRICRKFNVDFSIEAKKRAIAFAMAL